MNGLAIIARTVAEFCDQSNEHLDRDGYQTEAIFTADDLWNHPESVEVCVYAPYRITVRSYAGHWIMKVSRPMVIPSPFPTADAEDEARGDHMHEMETSR